MITQNQLIEILKYDKNTGIFTWINNGYQNHYKAGEIAGTLNSSGYIQIKIKGKCYRAHRLAWIYVYGESPKEQIDHINGIRNDNSINNIRECSHAENLQNQRKPQARNTSGFFGVSFDKSKVKYRAQISVNGKNINLGLFKTASSAHDVYLTAKRKYHEFCTI